MQDPTPSHDTHYSRGVALVLLGGLCLSPGGLLIRFIDSASDWQIVFYRSGFLALTVLGVLGVEHRSGVARAFRAAGWASLVGGVLIGLGFVTYVLAIRHTTVANALLIISTAPFGAALLGWPILGERVRPRTWAAMTLAAAGVLVMVYEGLGGGRLFGNLMGLGAALTFSGFAITLRLGRRVDMIPTLFIAGALAALLGAALADDLAVTRHDLVVLVVMGCLQMNLGFAFMTLGSRHVPAAQLTLLALVEVVLGPLWVALVLGEIPGLLALVGGAMVLTAVVGQALTPKRRPLSG
jgi:drug/metabolite transporter (DMT)-like permease